MTRSLPLVLALAVLLGGCGAEPRVDKRPFSSGLEVGTGDEREALKRMNALEADLAVAGGLQGEERVKAERDLGSQVAKTAETCVGTRLENKGWFLLASWRFQFVADPGATLEILDRLDRCGSPILKQAGRNLRVQALCRQGRLALARPIAEAVVRDIPQFQPTLDLVALHERCGQPAPALPGMTAPKTPILLVIAATWDASTRSRLEQLLQRAETTTWTPVVVLLDAAPTVTTEVPALLNRADLVAIHPRTTAEGDAWREAWTPPSEFFVAAMGADGTLLAVALRVDDPLPTLPGR